METVTGCERPSFKLNVAGQSSETSSMIAGSVVNADW